MKNVHIYAIHLWITDEDGKNGVDQVVHPSHARRLRDGSVSFPIEVDASEGYMLTFGEKNLLGANATELVVR